MFKRIIKILQALAEVMAVASVIIFLIVSTVREYREDGDGIIDDGVNISIDGMDVTDGDEGEDGIE